MDKAILKEFIAFDNLRVITYFFFTLAMTNLFISLKNTPETSFEEWRYLKISLLVFIVWGVIAFVKTILNIANKIKVIPSYFLNIEYLVVLIAVVLLSIGLYKIYQKIGKKFI